MAMRLIVIYPEDILAALLLLSWVMLVVFVLTRRLYGFMRRRGLEHEVSVYYNRKAIHVLAGGLSAVLVPKLFRSFVLPLIFSLTLAALLMLCRRRGRIMYWFQREDNAYEVSFCVMWGLILSLSWILTGGDFTVGILPIIFMSIGDAITGIVRNLIHKERTKSWWGNLAMAVFSVTAGAAAGLAGILSGAIASLVEHLEFKPIDDNVLIPAASFLILLLAKNFAPWSLTI